MADKQAPREGEILLYTGSAGAIRVEVLFEDESFWLTQKRMAELFEVTVPTINEHLKNVFKTGELLEDSVIRKFRITADDGLMNPLIFAGTHIGQISWTNDSDREFHPSEAWP